MESERKPAPQAGGDSSDSAGNGGRVHRHPDGLPYEFWLDSRTAENFHTEAARIAELRRKGRR